MPALVLPPKLNKSGAECLAGLSTAETQELLSRLTPTEAEVLEYDWSLWGRPSQFAPAQTKLGRLWATWLVLAGRGFGKTRTGAEYVRSMMCGPEPDAPGRWRHVAIVAETAADARDVMVGKGKQGTEASGLLQVHPPAYRPRYIESKRQLVWPNGAVGSIYNATEPDQLRGPQFDGAWLDELAKWRYAQATWDMLQLGLRTGKHPQVIVTTTPRPIKLLKDIIKDPDTVITSGSTYENANNLAENFLHRIERKYAGTRLGRQELEAELLEDVEGALWRRTQIDDLRVKPDEVPPMKRLVVSVDPAVSTNDGSNETGIIVVGLGEDGHGYVLDDRSGIHTPTDWGTQAVRLYRHYEADRVIGERNNGGDMVESTVRMFDKNVSYQSVWAWRSKFLRAEPVSALYEQGRVHHVGAFPKLEDQLCEFTADYDRARQGSPDRLDALVHGLTHLMVLPEIDIPMVGPIVVSGGRWDFPS